MADEPPWLTIPAAAEKLRVTQQAIRNRIKRGTLLTSRNNRDQILVQIPNSEQTGLATSSKPFSPPTEQDATVSLTRALELIAVAVAQERSRNAEETAHRITEIQTMHLDLVNRLQAQASVERSLWLERVDAAEVRAERVEQRLDQLLDQLLAERRQVLVPTHVEQAERLPWWRRWFGASKRSNLEKSDV